MADGDTPTTGSRFLDEETEAGAWKPGAERRVLKEINGRQYIVLEHAGENKGSWQFHSATPYTPPGGAGATATIATTDPRTGTVTQVAMTKEQIETDTAGLKYLAALREWETAPDEAKNEIALKTAIEGLNQARTKGAYLDAQLQQDLARGTQALEAGAVTIAQGREKLGRAPLERADILSQIGARGAQATGTQVDNMLKLVGSLGTVQAQRNAVAELFANGDIDEATADAVMGRIMTGLREGTTPAERIREEGETKRTVLTNEAALQRQREAETAKAAQALQAQQVTAATSITGDEAARQRQLLSSGVSQQANQAQAVNSFINNYQQGASPIASGRGFMDGLSMVRDIFSSIKDLAQPAPQLGQAQGFIGNLLGGGGAPPSAPSVMGPAAPVGTGVQNAVAPPAPPRDYLEDPLLAAAAMEDDTPLPPEDLAQIVPLMQTNPQAAANLSVAAWQRMVSGSGRPRRANATP